MMGRRDRIFWISLLLAWGLLAASVMAVIAERTYSRRGFQALEGICQEIIRMDPEAERTVISALKAYSLGDTEDMESSRILAYGYGPADFFQSETDQTYALAVCTGLTGGLLLLTAVFLMGRKEAARIRELTEYVEQVNRGKGGILLDRREDRYSGLQDEVYKTVTELYQTREAAVKARDHFAENLANIAHQIRTPLTAMDLSVQMMEKGACLPGSEWAPAEGFGTELEKMEERVLCAGTGDDRGSCGFETEMQAIWEKEVDGRRPEIRMVEAQTIWKNAGQIRRQIQRLTRLEESLLLLSRMDAGTLYMEKKEVDVFTVLMLAADHLQELSEKENVSVDIPEAGAVLIHADPDWTMEAVMNVLKNCIEHTPSGGRVRCQYEQNPLYTEIRIRDTGPGFQKGDLPHLFERFYRGQDAKEGSIGIGLALAKEIIGNQNGTIHAGNLPEGGAFFEIRFYSH